MIPRFLTVALAAPFLLAAPAQAHVTIDPPEAAVGGSFRAVLRVPHGCSGTPTEALRIAIPPGIINVKPMPHAGWDLEVIEAEYPAPVLHNGAEITRGATEIVWSGGNLPDSFYDEFVFRGTVASTLEPGADVYFPVIQYCPEAEAAWIATGGDAGNPAPSVTLTATGAPAH